MLMCLLHIMDQLWKERWTRPSHTTDSPDGDLGGVESCWECLLACFAEVSWTAAFVSPTFLSL